MVQLPGLASNRLISDPLDPQHHPTPLGHLWLLINRPVPVLMLVELYSAYLHPFVLPVDDNCQHKKRLVALPSDRQVLLVVLPVDCLRHQEDWQD